MNTILGILTKLRHKGLKLALDDSGNQLKITGDVSSLSTADREELSVNKAALIEFLKESTPKKGISIVRGTEKDACIPLTPNQQSIWVHQHLFPQSNMYIIPVQQEWPIDSFNSDCFTKALQILVHNTDVLRFRFYEKEGIPVQQTEKVVLENHARYLKIDALTENEQTSEEITAAFFEDSIRVDDNKPLWKLLLLELSPNICRLCLQVHHLIMDGESLKLFLARLHTVYNALLNGVDFHLETLQFGDYANWLNNRENTASHSTFWKKYLLDYQEFTLESDVRIYESVEKEQSVTTNEIVSKLSPELNEKLLQKAAEKQLQKTTLFTLAYAIVLSKHTRTNDVLMGLPVACRETDELLQCIGDLANIVPLRVQIPYDKYSWDYLKNLQKDFWDILENQRYPLEYILQDIAYEHQSNHSPLFNTIISFLEMDAESGNSKEINGFQRSTSLYDLSLTVMQFQDDSWLHFEYDTSVYSTEFIQRIADQTKLVLTQLVHSSDTQLLSNIEISSPDDKHLILNEFNDTTVQRTGETLIDLFKKRVQLSPDNRALEFEGKYYSYTELDFLSDKVAAFLVNHSILPGSKIGICIPRSEKMILAMMGVLKMGGTYIPIDPDYPEERISFLMKDSQTSYCLTNEVVESIVANTKESNVVISDYCPKAEDLAYVMYTSGSTGTPKGVMIPHASLCDYAQTVAEHFQLTEKDVVIQQSSISFDVSVEEIFPALITGAKLVILREGGANIERLLSAITNNKASFLSTTPLVVNELNNYPDALTTLRVLICGGDTLKGDYVNRLIDKTTFYNTYGPTETTVCASYLHVTDIRNIDSIGRPITNRHIVILDSEGNLLPVGVKGEICVSGKGVAKGYFNREDLTKQQFVQSPWYPNEIMYKTGDLGCWLPDGTIRFCGRLDNQIKIRGYRIEPGEIEKALCAINGIREAIVLADQREITQLVAFILADSSATESTIREQLNTKLPSYMIPSGIYLLEQFPVNANGKLDANALLEISRNDSPGQLETLPTDELEETIMGLWNRILNKEICSTTTNFFLLGGHSLKAMYLRAEYQRLFGVEIGLSELLEYPTIVSHAKAIRRSSKKVKRILQAPAREYYELTHAQKRLWVICQDEDASLAYNMYQDFSFTCDENDVDSFRNAVTSVLNRHNILRSRLSLVNEEPVMIITSSEFSEETLKEYDLRSTQNPDEKCRELIKADVETPFALQNGALIRMSLFRLENARYCFFLNMHHIIGDGWSMGVFTRDLQAFFEVETGKIKEKPRALEIQFTDIAIWNQELEQTGDLTKLKHYWLEKLAGPFPVLQLPSEKERPPYRTYTGKGLSTIISAEDTNRLNQFVLKRDGTLFMGLLTTLKILFFRYTRTDDIIIGSPVASREEDQLADQIGFYANTIALRDKLSADKTVDELFRDIRRTCLDAYDNQAYPFDLLVEDLGVKTDKSRNPLFDCMLLLQLKEQNGVSYNIHAAENTIEPTNTSTAKFDLLFNFTESEKGLGMQVEFNTDVFDEVFIVNLITHFKTLLNKLPDCPELPLGKIKYFEDSEHHLSTINQSDINEFQSFDLFEDFKKQVEKKKDVPAVECGQLTISYNQLSQRVNVIESALFFANNSGKSTNIGVLLERSADSVASMIAVMRSGNCYVPIDPDYPEDRIKFILSDAGIRILIVSNETINCVANLSLETINIDQLVVSSDPIPEIKSHAGRSDRSYIIYTSGSTGKPKGVVQTYRMLNNLIRWNIYHSGIETGLKQLHYSSFCFDVSIQDVWFVLCSGGMLSVVEQETKLDFDALREYVVSRRINVLSFPFTALSNLFGYQTDQVLENHSIRHIISSGEQLVINKPLRSFLKRNPSVALHNHYGPSETHVVTFHTVSAEKGNLENRVPIGKPVTETIVALLDESKEPVPSFVTGELFIGGANVGEGYLNLPELTQERFVELAEFPGERFYKTGDLGYRRNDGTLIYLGRNDHQVKVRGFRVELTEIELAISNLEGIEDAVVVAETLENETILTAYFIGSSTRNGRELRSKLREVLPDYMLPLNWVRLDTFPLTTNGKVDRKKLSSSQHVDVQRDAQPTGYSTETEHKLAALWQEILYLQVVSEDDFFDLGGNSLKVIKLMHGINREFGIKLTVKELFIHSNFREQVTLLESNRNNMNYDSIPVNTSNKKELSPVQQRLWATCQYADANKAYNLPLVFLINGRIDTEMVRLALLKVMERHEIMRSVITLSENQEPLLKVLPLSEMEHTVSILPMEEITDSNILIEKFVLQPFELIEKPLLRVCIAQTKIEEHLFILNMHHLIGDGWSMNIILSEMTEFYDALFQKREANLPDLKIQYCDFATWQKELIEGGKGEQDLSYWSKRLKMPLPVLQLPLDFPRDEKPTYNGANYSFELPVELVTQLTETAQKLQVSLFALTLSSYAIFLKKLAVCDNIVIGTSFAGRNHHDLANLVGFFVNTLPIPLTPEDNLSFKDFVADTHNRLLDDFDHADLPFDQIIAALGIARIPGISPVFQTRFVLDEFGLNKEMESYGTEGGLTLSEYPVTYNDAKFDLSTNMRHINGRLFVNFEYKTTLFKEESIKRFSRIYTALLGKLLHQPKFLIMDSLSEDTADVTKSRNLRQEKLSTLKTLFKNDL